MDFCARFAKCCQTKGAWSFAKNRKVARAPQKIKRIDEWDDSSNDNESVVDDENIVLTGDENGQFTMTGRVNSNPFTAMVDSGSPVTFFEVDEILKIMKRKTLFIGELPSENEYVDFNRSKLNFLGYIFCQLEVGNTKPQKFRILVSEGSKITNWT